MPARPTYSDTVLPIIRHVREMLLPYYGRISFTEKAERRFDLVTELDKDVERFLKRELEKTYPRIGFVGEEEGGERSAKQFWLVDPIDGTAHFIRGIPFCTTMVALIENGEVVFSAIYDFVNDMLYSAEQGSGAFANGAPIRVSDRPLAGSFIGYETHLEKPENMHRVLRLREKCMFIRAACSGFEYTLVATGKIETRLAFDPHGKDYDFAPGSLLVQEAGGVAANIGKKTYDYRNGNFIAANPIVFKELTEGPDAIFPITS